MNDTTRNPQVPPPAALAQTPALPQHGSVRSNARRLALYASAAQETRRMEGDSLMLPDSVIEPTVTAYAFDTHGNPQPLGVMITNAEGSSARMVSLLAAESVPSEVWVTYFFERMAWKPHYVAYADDERITSITMRASIDNATDSDVRRADIVLVVGDVPLPRMRYRSARGGSGAYESSQPVMLRARAAAAAPRPQAFLPETLPGGEAEGEEGGWADLDTSNVGSELARIPIAEDSLSRGSTDISALVIRSPDSFKAYYCDVTPVPRPPVALTGTPEGPPVYMGYRLISRNYLPAGGIVVYAAGMNLLGSSRLADTVPGKPTDVVIRRSSLVACESAVTVEERELPSSVPRSAEPGRHGAMPRWFSGPEGGTVLAAVEAREGAGDDGGAGSGWAPLVGPAVAEGYGTYGDEDDGEGSDDDSADGSEGGVGIGGAYSLATAGRSRRHHGGTSEHDSRIARRRRPSERASNGDAAFVVVERRTTVRNKITNSTNEEVTVLLKCAVGDDVYDLQPRPNGPMVGGKAEWAIGVPAASDAIYDIVIVTRNMVPKRGSRQIAIY